MTDTAKQDAGLPLQGGAGERKWTLRDGIAELKREQRQRARVYPRLVASGRLEQREADQQNRDLQGMLTFAEFCLKNEARLRQVLKDA